MFHVQFLAILIIFVRLTLETRPTTESAVNKKAQADLERQMIVDHAMIHGNWDLVGYLLENSNHDRALDLVGTSPLISAVRFSDSIELIVKLLDSRADVNHADGKGRTALLHSVNAGSIDLVKVLISRGANVHISENHNGATPLALAASDGNLEIVNELLKSKADVHCTDFGGNTPLMLSSKNGHKHVVQALFEHGSKIEHTDKQGDTALVHAATNGRTEVLKFLIYSKANVNHVNKKDGLSALMSIANTKPYKLNQTSFDRLNNQEEIVQILLKAKADPELKTQNLGQTALQLAVMNNIFVIELLVLYGADTSKVSKFKLVKKALATKKTMSTSAGTFLAAVNFLQPLPGGPGPILEVIRETVENWMLDPLIFFEKNESV